MQRSRPALALGCHIGAVLNEEPDNIHTAPSGRQMQRSRPVLVPGCRVGAVLDEKPHYIHITS